MSADRHSLSRQKHMMKTSGKTATESATSADSIHDCRTLHRLQIELVTRQSSLMNCDEQIRWYQKDPTQPAGTA